jgi:hypothetical protein
VNPSSAAKYWIPEAPNGKLSQRLRPAQRACAYEGREGTTEYGQPRRTRKREKEAEEGSGKTIRAAAETNDSLQACATDTSSARKVVVLKLKTAAEIRRRNIASDSPEGRRVFKFAPFASLPGYVSVGQLTEKQQPC